MTSNGPPPEGAEPPSAPMNVEELRRRASEIHWFHTMDLGHGIITRGIDNTPRKLAALGLPVDLSGRTVLDIGAWDGSFSFEAERRGARRVVALDSYCWSGPGWGTKAGFELAREAYGSRVEDVEMDVLDMSAQRPGVFDLVLFLGVLYHLRHPLLALEKVAAVTGRQLILETAVDLIQVPVPALAFYAGKELGNDPTNWWAPNPRGLRKMLEAVGFHRVQVVRGPRPLAWRLWRAAGRVLRRGISQVKSYQRDRIVVHAWK